VLESSVERRVKQWADAHGILNCKFTATGSAGWPDRIFWIAGGRPKLVEFKKQGESPTKLQLHRMRQLKNLDYDVFWTDNADEAISYLGS
jgi:hypothetical protein